MSYNLVSTILYGRVENAAKTPQSMKSNSKLLVICFIFFWFPLIEKKTHRKRVEFFGSNYSIFVILEKDAMNEFVCKVVGSFWWPNMKLNMWDVSEIGAHAQICSGLLHLLHQSVWQCFLIMLRHVTHNLTHTDDQSLIYRQ